VLLSDLAAIRTVSGPAMIRTENGLLTGYVYVDLDGRDPGSFISQANPLLRSHLKLPPGYAVAWSGQYETIQRANARLQTIIPLTLFLICVLLYASTRSSIKTLIILMAVPFSAVGAIWFLYLAGYHMSVAVWVGLIALLGIDAETAVFMLLYLDLACDQAKRAGRLKTATDLQEAIVEGAAKRLRPKFMTFAATCIGLVPLMLATGAGSDVLKRIAAPMIGGIFTSFLLELLVYPAIYNIWKSPSLSQGLRPAAISPANELQTTLSTHDWWEPVMREESQEKA
jgi:Cu(I)/Ag(I) efflux system membrane protein CusA/SilA